MRLIPILLAEGGPHQDRGKGRLIRGKRLFGQALMVQLMRQRFCKEE